ncbi:hypothetical protein BDD12DRAFT_878370 [Trichophaea hybrida]|nr:hypothetical protein BDD12DRAFT_878370 [Trichophaea hybrida]
MYEIFYYALDDINHLLPTNAQVADLFTLPDTLTPIFLEFARIRAELLNTTSAATPKAAIATVTSWSKFWDPSSILSVIPAERTITGPADVARYITYLIDAVNNSIDTYGDLKRLTGTTKTAEAVNDLATLTSAGWTFQQLLALLPSLFKAWKDLTARFPGSPSVTLAGLADLLTSGISSCDHPARVARSLGLPEDTPFETSLLAIERLRLATSTSAPAPGPHQKQIEVPKYDSPTDKMPYHDWVAALERKFLVDYLHFSSPRGIAAYIIGLLSGTAARVATTFPLQDFAESFIGPRSAASAISAVSSVVILLDPEFKDHNLLSNSGKAFKALYQNNTEFQTFCRESTHLATLAGYSFENQETRDLFWARIREPLRNALVLNRLSKLTPFHQVRDLCFALDSQIPRDAPKAPKKPTTSASSASASGASGNFRNTTSTDKKLRLPCLSGYDSAPAANKGPLFGKKADGTTDFSAPTVLRGTLNTNDICHKCRHGRSAHGPPPPGFTGDGYVTGWNKPTSAAVAIITTPSSE